VTAAVSLADLTRARVAEIAPTAVLVMAFGAAEQHGPHLPFGTDFLVVDAIARRAADRAAEHAPVVLAPTLPFGSSHHHLEVGGALSLSPPAFEACARDLFGAAAATGFRRLFVLNGHGGNEQLLRTAAHAAAGDTLVVGGGSYWALARAQLQRLVPGPAPVPGHAGRFETSLALALGAPTAPPPARESWTPAGATPFWLEDASAWRRIDGYTDSPADGNADEGAVCLDAIVAAVADGILEFERSTRETG
jgi:creatinine amidohydrolase